MTLAPRLLTQIVALDDTASGTRSQHFSFVERQIARRSGSWHSPRTSGQRDTSVPGKPDHTVGKGIRRDDTGHSYIVRPERTGLPINSMEGRSQAPCLLFSPLNPPFELLFFSRSTAWQQRLMRRSSSAGQDHAAACCSLMLRRCSWQSGRHQQRCVGLPLLFRKNDKTQLPNMAKSQQNTLSGLTLQSNTGLQLKTSQCIGDI